MIGSASSHTDVPYGQTVGGAGVVEYVVSVVCVVVGVVIQSLPVQGVVVGVVVVGVVVVGVVVGVVVDPVIAVMHCTFNFSIFNNSLKI